MKVNFLDMKLLGLQDKVSGKGNKYTVGLFQQGTGVDTANFMLPSGSYELNKVYDLTADYDFKWKSFKVLVAIPKK